MARMHFEEERNRIHHDVLAMGARVEEDIRKAIAAAKSGDDALAREVKADDAVVNAMQVKIEDQAAILMATQQPVASDLRELVATIKLVNDLERIGDHAVHLAKAVIKLKDEPRLPQMETLAEMADIGAGMVRGAVTAYIERDEAMAREVAATDAEIDTRHKRTIAEMIAFIADNPGKSAQAARIMTTSGFLERLGDHVTNMCEAVVYLVSGEHAELNG